MPGVVPAISPNPVASRKLVLGSVSERPKVQLSKSCVRESAPWVQIPPGPPIVKASPNGEAFTICALVGVVECAGPTPAPSAACLCEGVSRVGRQIPPGPPKSKTPHSEGSYFLLGSKGAGIWEEAVLWTADGSHRDRPVISPGSSQTLCPRRYRRRAAELCCGSRRRGNCVTH